MVQAHGDRLSTADAALLAMESPTRYMHVGSLFRFAQPEAGDFTFERFARLVRARLHLVPRYRHKLAWAPLNLSNPIWVDDPRFDLAFHLRHAALPGEGTDEQLTQYATRVWTRQLDRDRPLWELYLIDGLEDGGFAVLSKHHHAMVDGMGGLDLVSLLLDPAEGSDLPGADTPPQEWEPAEPPSDHQLAFSGVRGVVSSPVEAFGSAKRIFDTPTKAARKAMRVGRGILSVAGTTVSGPAPRSELNQPVGQSRRFATGRVSLEDARTIRAAYRTTINDVVLALVGDTTGRVLRDHGVDTEQMWLRVMVPISVASDADSHAFGQRVVSAFVSVPVGEMDPVERLRVIHEAMSTQSAERTALGAQALTGLANFAPSTIHAMASRLAARSRLYNFMVMNVPGPREPVFLLGARLVGAFPFTPLTGGSIYGVGVVSTDGWLNVGFTADHLGLPEVEQAPRHLQAAMVDLLRCAEAVGPAAGWPGDDVLDDQEAG